MPVGALITVSWSGEVGPEPGPFGGVGVLAVREVACGEPQERAVFLLAGGCLVRAVQVGRVGAGRDGHAAERGAQGVAGLAGDPDLGVAAQILACVLGQLDQLIDRHRGSPLPFCACAADPWSAWPGPGRPGTGAG